MTVIAHFVFFYLISSQYFSFDNFAAFRSHICLALHQYSQSLFKYSPFELMKNKKNKSSLFFRVIHYYPFYNVTHSAPFDFRKWLILCSLFKTLRYVYDTILTCQSNACDSYFLSALWVSQSNYKCCYCFCYNPTGYL